MLCAQVPNMLDTPIPTQVDGETPGGAAGSPVAGAARSARVVVASVPAAGVAAAAGGPVSAPPFDAAARALVEVEFPLRLDRTAACARGFAVAVHVARQLVIIAGALDNKLHCYNLRDGLESSVVGRGFGAGDMQFHWSCGGVCVTPRGTLLVAEYFNHRVPEVDLDSTDHFLRVFGQGEEAPAIEFPQYVDCNGVHVVVSEVSAGRICVLSYADGSLVRRIGLAGAMPLCSPRGVKLLADGSGVMVADYGNDRVVLLSLAGNMQGSVPQRVQLQAELERPFGVVQCAAPDGDVVVMVACSGAAGNWTRLTKVSFRGGVLESVDKPAGSGHGSCYCVFDIATLPEGGLVALDYDASRFQLFSAMALRMVWIRLAVSWQCHHGTRP